MKSVDLLIHNNNLWWNIVSSLYCLDKGPDGIFMEFLQSKNKLASLPLKLKSKGVTSGVKCDLVELWLHKDYPSR